MGNVQRGPDNEKTPRLRLVGAGEAPSVFTKSDKPGLVTDGPISMQTSKSKARKYAELARSISNIADAILKPEPDFVWENEGPAAGKNKLVAVSVDGACPKEARKINKALILEKLNAVLEDSAIELEAARLSKLIADIERECPETVSLPLEKESLAQLVEAIRILGEAMDLLGEIAEGVFFDAHMENYEDACARIYGCVGALFELEEKLGYPLKVSLHIEEKNKALMTLPELSRFAEEFLLCKLDEDDPNVMVAPDWRTLGIGGVDLRGSIQMASFVMQQLEHLVAIARTLEVRDGKLCVAEGDVVAVDFANRGPAE